MRKSDGGPAFPSHVVCGSIYNGMSLRDWFAGQAMAAFIANSEISRNWKTDAMDRPQEDTAIAAYKLADAMLKEREKE